MVIGYTVRDSSGCLIRLSAGIPKSLCNRQIIFSVNGRLRLRISYTRFDRPISRTLRGRTALGRLAGASTQELTYAFAADSVGTAQ